jgi:hypothetical protein
VVAGAVEVAFAPERPHAAEDRQVVALPQRASGYRRGDQANSYPGSASMAGKRKPPKWAIPKGHFALYRALTAKKAL